MKIIVWLRIETLKNQIASDKLKQPDKDDHFLNILLLYLTMLCQIISAEKFGNLLASYHVWINKARAQNECWGFMIAR